MKRASYIIIYIYLLIALFKPAATCQVYDTLYNNGVTSYISGDYESSAEYLLDFLNRERGLSNKERHSLHLRLAFLISWTSSFNQALGHIAAADSLENAGVVPDSIAIADRLIIKAINEYGKNNLTNAADALIESVQFRSGRNDFEKAVLATTYGFQGLIYRKLKDYPTSEGYYLQAIKLDRELSRQRVLAQELSELAGSRMVIDPFDPLIDQVLKEALDIYIALEDSLYQASVHNEYGILYQKRGNHRKALQSFLNSVDLRLASGKDSNLDIIYNNIGAIYESMQNTDSSLSYFHKAIKYARSTDKKIPGRLYSNLGSRYGRLGNNDSALHYFNLAIWEVVPEGKETFDDSILYSRISPQLPDFLAGRATTLYNIYRESGDLKYLKASISSYDIALHQLDTLRFLYSFDNKPLAIKENRKYYALALQYATELFEKTNDRADLEKAFLLAGRSKGLVFDEYLRVNEARQFLNINPGLLKSDDSLKMLKTTVMQKTLELNPEKDKDSELKARYSSLLFDIDESLRVLNREIKEKNPSYYRLIHKTPSYPSALLREKLKEQEIIIDFTWHEDQLIVFGLSRDEFLVRKQTTTNELRHRIGKYRSFLEGSSTGMSYNQFKEESHDLYEILLKPWESSIGNKTIFFITDDSLAFLPFETLLYELPDGTGADYSKLPYLISRNTVSYLHSIQQFAMARGNNKIVVTEIDAFAPFADHEYQYGNTRLQKLSGTANEIKSIKKLLPARLFLSSRATEERFRSSLGKERIIHAATHGLQADSSPMENHILFYPQGAGEDYKFHLFELLGIQVEAPLVVLSSCNTGAGTFQPGEGVLSLARAFHFAGTKSLLMSQWLIDDEAASTIMNYFYQGLKKGFTLAVALQEAKLRFIEQGGKTGSNPYYWASFQLTGFSDTITVSDNRDNMTLLVFGGSLLLALIILLTVRLYMKRKIQ